MRRVAVIAVSFVIASGVVVPAASASRVLVIKVRSVPIAGTYTAKDVSPKGPSKGDRYSGRDTLLNAVQQFGRRSGAAVGTDRSTLALTGTTTGCVTGVANLPGGTILFKGCGHLGVNVPTPVVGGTGAFAGARGTTVAGPGNTPLNTYRLTLP
jgi:hypothetical protein